MKSEQIKYDLERAIEYIRYLEAQISELETENADLRKKASARSLVLCLENIRFPQYEESEVKS